MADKVAMAGPASPLLVPWWAGFMISTVSIPYPSSCGGARTRCVVWMLLAQQAGEDGERERRGGFKVSMRPD